MAATNLYKKFLQGIGLVPKASSTNAVLGDLEALSSDNRLHFFGTSNDVVTTDAVTTTLTNKTIAAGSNTITGLTNTNLSGSAGISIANGGTGQATKAAAFDALQPMTTGGDLIYGGASGTGTRLPNGSAGQFLQSNGGTAAPSWATSATANESYLLQNLGLAVSVASNAMTIALKQADGATDPTTGSGVVIIGQRSSTANSGAFNLRSVTGALSIVIPSGATLGQISAMDQYVWVYAIDNAGTIELAVSGVNVFADNSIASTTAISGSATSGTTLYSTTARTNVPIRIIGRLLVNETTAGTWASNTTDIVLAPKPTPTITERVAYTPVIGGMGTCTNVSGYSYRDGKYLKGTVYFAVGTSTAVAATATYGFNGVSGNVNLDSSIAGNAINTVIGNGTTNSSFAAQYVPLANSTYLSIGIQSSTTGGLVGQNGSSISGPSGTQFCFTYEVPVQGWSTYGP